MPGDRELGRERRGRPRRMDEVILGSVFGRFVGGLRDPHPPPKKKRKKGRLLFYAAASGCASSASFVAISPCVVASRSMHRRIDCLGRQGRAYDGVCGKCSNHARTAHRRDRRVHRRGLKQRNKCACGMARLDLTHRTGQRDAGVLRHDVAWLWETSAQGVRKAADQRPQERLLTYTGKRSAGRQGPAGLGLAGLLRKQGRGARGTSTRSPAIFRKKKGISK